MSITEKLKVFEALWDDLAASPDSLSSPAWHEAIIEQRQKKVESGGSGFTDIRKFKQRITKRIS